MADEWEDLAVRIGASPFARPGWIEPWWTAFGSGEPFIVTLRHDGELAAVLPLGSRLGLLRSCSNIHSPLFEGVAAEPDDLRAAIAAAVGESGAGLILSRVDAAGPLAAAARAAAELGAGRLLELGSAPSLYVDPAETWEEYEAKLGRSRRKELRRNRRRLSEQGELEIEVEITDVGFERFLELEASGWKASQGTAIRQSPHLSSFYRQATAWASEKGLLNLVFLRLDGRPLAAELTIDDGRRRYPLKVGFAEELRRYSPGMILAVDEIRRAIEDGRSSEWGTGVGAVNTEMSNAQRTIEEIGIFPRGPRGGTARLAVSAQRASYRRARRSPLLRRLRDALRR